jgi:two-component system, LytTR family, response regulator
MKAVIIDDERRARLLLSAMVADHCPQLTVVAECEDLPSGIKAIKREKPNIVFLDIEMPGHSGLELLDFFEESEVNFYIIFTTAYSEYAIRAFKMSAVDYLLKPIQPDELIKSVELANKRNEQITSLKVLHENLFGKSKKIMLNQTKGIEFLDTNEILFFKGNGAYTEIHKKDGSSILASKNLKHFEELLADIPQFFRTQKSFIVNTSYVNQIQKDEGSFSIAFGEHAVSISIDKIDELLNLIK